MKEAQIEASVQREEAKKLLLSCFGIKASDSNGDLERAVDCIINAAILESMLIINEGLRKN